jgi:hypothetical protein
MKKLLGIYLLVFLVSMAYSVGFEGYLLTTEGDTLTNTVVKAKQGTGIIDQCTSNENGYYSVDFGEVGVVPYQLPSDEMILGNSITSNGRVIAFTSISDCQYNIFDIRGRNVTGSRLASGKYFLQLVDARTKEVRGVRPFINMSQGKMKVQIKSFESPSFAKVSADDDSLVVEYTGTDMLVHPYREKVILPEEGFEHKDLLLQRERRDPVVSVVLPDTMTIDTTYVLKIDAFCEDYDAVVANISVQFVGGDSINYEHHSDSLIISPHTRGKYDFRITAHDNQGGQTSTDITFAVNSDVYKFFASKLFFGLGLGRPDLDVTIRNKTERTDENGVAVFEFPKGELSDNVYYDTFWLRDMTTDSLVITDNINGTLQDTTGYFIKMHKMLNPSAINNEGLADTMQVIDEPMVKENRNYWNDYAHANLIDELVYLLPISAENDYNLSIRGNLEDGRMDLLHYSPEHDAQFFEGDSLSDYRLMTQQAFDTLRYEMIKFSQNEAGNGKTPYNFVNLSESPDSVLAIEKGNTFDFSLDRSESKYLLVDVDLINSIRYIRASGQYVDGSSRGPSLKRTIMHELGRAFEFTKPSKYVPGTLSDIMRNGELRKHDAAEFYFMLNADPHILGKIADIESLIPNSNP